MIPTIVAVILWKWLLNDSYGLVNHMLMSAGLVRTPVAWLGPDYIMASLIVTSVWQFFPSCGDVPGAPADHPARALRGGYRRRRVGVAPVRARHPASDRERALRHRAPAQHLMFTKFDTVC